MKIPPSSLQTGDVLLYQGTALISQLIILFDGGKYSHASIYDGTNIVEMQGNGTIVDSVSQSIEGSRFVDVYRFVSTTGKRLGDPQCPLQPVLGRIHFYEQHPERYGYEQLLLLALLASTRRPAWGAISPPLAMILRTILDNAADVLADMIHAGRQPMICSELVYRCYIEAVDPYQIIIRGADVPFACAGTPLPPPAPEERELQRASTNFLMNYALAKGQDIGAESFTAEAAVADFVTPHDLEVSPDLQRLGTLG